MLESAFRIHLMWDGVYRIEGQGEEYAYLVLGTRRAALVDACAGYGSIRRAVESMTGLPLVVLNTHGHVDHAGGDYDFDEVFLHPADVPLMQTETEPERRMWFLRKIAAAKGTQAVFSQAMLALPRPIRLLPICDGQEFDLGGTALQALHVPGHTRGSVCFVDRERRLLLGGDSFHAQVQLFFDYSASVACYARSLERIGARRKDFDLILPCHNQTPLSPACLDELSQACAHVLQGGAGVPQPDGSLAAYAVDAEGFRLDGRVGNIFYAANHITDNQEDRT